MSLKVPPAWLRAPVSMYDTRKKMRRPPPPKPASEPRSIGRHGAFLIVEIRDERGRKALRYVRD